MTAQNTIHRLLNQHQGKKLVIFGAGNGGLYIHYHALECGVQTAYFVDNHKAGETFCRLPVLSPFELMYEDPEKLLVVIGVNQRSFVDSIVEQLKGMGLSEGKNFEIPEFGNLYAPADYLDPLLGYSRKNELPGFKVLHSGASDPLKVFCLGGSTSDWSFGGYRCWGDFFWRMLNDVGLAADFYNGAVAGYHSSLELLKLIRDVIPLKPDCLLVLNGVNDGNQKFLEHHPMHHSYSGKVFERFTGPGNTAGLEINGEIKGVLYGPDDDSSPVEVYVRNMRMMKALCDEFKILFFPVLQPIRKFQESLVSDMALVKFYSDAVKAVSALPFMTDGSNWLGSGDDLFFDYIHYNETGNRKIAEKLLELAFPMLKERKS